MEKNEYRRSLIMLRSLASGYTGHARLEVRTLTGMLNILASLPQGAQNIQAALIGSRLSEYFAVPIGALKRDLRGQAGLSITFDPRRIGGRTLEAYSMLVLLNTDNGSCSIVLAGNIAGTCQVDWAKVRAAVCGVFLSSRDDVNALPPQAQPRGDEGTAQAEKKEGETAAQPQTNDSGSAQKTETDTNTAEPAQELIWGFPEEKDKVSGDEPENKIVAEAPGTASEESADNAADEPADDMPEGAQSQAAQDASEDESLPEAAYVENQPFARQGWKFTRVALPAQCGYEYSYVGLPDSAQAPAEICCAIPAHYSPEPPVGLDDFEWSGGSGNGWWIKCYIVR